MPISRNAVFGLLLAWMAIVPARAGEGDLPVVVYNHLDYVYGLGLTAAAEDMARLLSRATGRDIAAVRLENAKETAGPRILLGSAAIQQYNLQAEAEALPHGGAVIRAVDGDLLIFGNNAKGTSNGIYSYLRDEMGMRFFQVGELFTRIPPRARAIVADVDRTAIPDNELRTILIHPDGGEEAILWARRNRLAIRSYEKSEPFSNFGHGLAWLFPTDRFAATHPEYYPLYWGARYIPKPGEDWWQPCLANADPAVAVEKAVGFFSGENMEEVTTFDMGMNDSVSLCECPECLKLRRQLPNTTDYFFQWLNRVGRGLRTALPGREIRLGTMSYFQTRYAPTRPVDPAVFTAYCADVGQYFDSGFLTLDAEQQRKWMDAKVPVAVYTYLSGDQLAPSYYPGLLDQEMKRLKAMGCVGFHDDALLNLAWSGPLYYLFANLCWETSQDAKALLDEYFTSLYGAAAPAVRDAFERFEEIHSRPRRGGFLRDYESLWELEPWRLEDVTFLRERLTRARDVVEADTDEGRRLAWLAEHWEPSLATLHLITLARQAALAPETLTPAERKEALARAADYPARMEAAQTLHRAQHGHDPFTRKMLGHAPLMDWQLTRHFAEFLALCESTSAAFDEDEKAAFATAVTVLTAAPFGSMALAKARGTLTFASDNLVADPSFERWPLKGVPAEWRHWTKTSHQETFGVTGKTARTGKRSVYLKDHVDGGCLYVEIDGLRAGDAYLVRVYGRGEDGFPNAELRINWRLGGAWQWQHPSYHLFAQRGGDWEELWTPIVVPEGVDGMAVVFSAKNLYGGGAVYFDDIEVRKISRRD